MFRSAALIARARPDMVKIAITPDYALSSHVAALGLALTMDSAPPDAYANGAFVGHRGSWNRSAFNGYKVVYVPFENGMPAGMAQDVVTGFLDGDPARGRPVGLAIDGTAALPPSDVNKLEGVLTSLQAENAQIDIWVLHLSNTNGLGN